MRDSLRQAQALIRALCNRFRYLLLEQQIAALIPSNNGVASDRTIDIEFTRTNPSVGKDWVFLTQAKEPLHPLPNTPELGRCNTGRVVEPILKTMDQPTFAKVVWISEKALGRYRG